MIVARGVFAWCPAGYRKSSCYQLLAFAYDFELKWTRSCGTERTLCLCYRWCWPSSTYSYSVRSPFTFTGDEFMVQYMVIHTDNLAHTHYHPCNEYQAVFPPPPSRSIVGKNGLGTRLCLYGDTQRKHYFRNRTVNVLYNYYRKQWTTCREV